MRIPSVGTGAVKLVSDVYKATAKITTPKFDAKYGTRMPNPAVEVSISDEAKAMWKASQGAINADGE